MRNDLYRHKMTQQIQLSLYIYAIFASNDSNKIYFRIFRILQKILIKYQQNLNILCVKYIKHTHTHISGIRFTLWLSSF